MASTRSGIPGDNRRDAAVSGRVKGGGLGKGLLFMGGATLVALITTLMIYRLMSGMEKSVMETAASQKPISIAAASNDLPMGVVIEEDDIEMINVFPASTNRDLVFLTTEGLIGRTPRERILAGEAIRAERLAHPDAGLGLNAIITSGKRAMTIETNGEAGVGGFLKPDNYVDVIVTIRPDDASMKAKWVTETILQGVRILAIGDRLTGSKKAEDDDKRSRSRFKRTLVTLEVLPDQAEKLALSSSQGQIHLVLRSDVDIERRDTTGPLVTRSLLGGVPEAPRSTRSSRKSGSTAVIIEGGNTQVERFDGSGAKVSQPARRKRR